MKKQYYMIKFFIVICCPLMVRSLSINQWLEAYQSQIGQGILISNLRVHLNLKFLRINATYIHTEKRKSNKTLKLFYNFQ